MARGSVSPAESWDAFFSEFYLRAYADDERDARAEGQALAAARLAAVPEGGDVLDAPCGFGRHSIPLARAGYRVTGADRAQPLIDEARCRSPTRASTWSSTCSARSATSATSRTPARSPSCAGCCVPRVGSCWRRC